MFEKNMRIAYLLDFYHDVLDEHTAAVMKSYYNDDLSLAEIAGDVGISRQGIRHLIKKGEERLEFLEERLGLAKRHSELDGICESLTDIKNELEEREIVATDEEIDEIADYYEDYLTEDDSWHTSLDIAIDRFEDLKGDDE